MAARPKCPACNRALPKPKASKVDPVWPSTAFWTAAYLVLAFTSNAWGHNPQPRAVWRPGRLRIAAGGHEQCGYGWNTRAA